jgi:hypothetical protein
MKRIVSFSLEKETITKLCEISLSYGKSRSETIDILVNNFYTPEMKVKAEKILHLQSEQEMKKY